MSGHYRLFAAARLNDIRKIISERNDVGSKVDELITHFNQLVLVSETADSARKLAVLSRSLCNKPSRIGDYLIAEIVGDSRTLRKV